MDTGVTNPQKKINGNETHEFLMNDSNDSRRSPGPYTAVTAVVADTYTHIGKAFEHIGKV